MYCNTLHIIHKCLNPSLNPLLALTITATLCLFSLHYSGLQLNLFSAVTCCGRMWPPCVRHYFSHPTCSTVVSIFLENMSCCVIGCVTDQYTFCVLSPPCTCITPHSMEPSSLMTPLLSIPTSYPSRRLPLYRSLSPVEK